MKELTIDVYCREDDAVEGSDGREKQGSSQASVPEPVIFSSEDAGCYEDIVSMREKKSTSVNWSGAKSIVGGWK